METQQLYKTFSEFYFDHIKKMKDIHGDKFNSDTFYQYTAFEIYQFFIEHGVKGKE